MQKGQFVLTGTAVVEQKSVAFLRESAGGKSRSVRVGETINGLLVAEVKPDRVRLTMGEDSEELLLKVAAGPRTTIQPAQPVAPGGPGGPGAPQVSPADRPWAVGAPAAAAPYRGRRRPPARGAGRVRRCRGLAARAPTRSSRRPGGGRSGGTARTDGTAGAAVGTQHDDTRDAFGAGPGLGRGLSPHAAAETLTDRNPMRELRPECRPGAVYASPETAMNHFRPYRMAVAALALLALAACQTTPEAPPGTPGAQRVQQHKATPGVPAPLADVAARAADPEEKGDPYRIFKGTGIVVKGQQPGGGVPPSPAAPPSGGGVVLNFEGADLREVVRNILGDILGESYTIDPAVGGQVTIRTTSGVPRDALYATLETILRMNGATMVKEGGLFKIVPQAAAVRGNVTPQLGSSQRALPAGFSVQIVPLRYVGARDMIRILEPFAKDAQAVRADELRNLLVLAGTERELRHLLDAIDMFDIDWMAGMSAGVFVLQNADVKSVMGELDKVIGNPQQSPLAGLLRIVPIERMNALLVISPNPAYLEQAKQWVERLDRGGGGDGPRLFVYAMQNSRAERVAPLLQQAFTGRAQAAAAAPPPTLAPGTPAGTIVSPPTFQPFTQPQPITPGQAAGAVAAGLAAAFPPVRRRPARPAKARASCATCRRSPTGTTTRSSSSPRPSSTR